MLRHFIEFKEAYYYKRQHRIEIYDNFLSSGTTTELIPQLPPAKLFYDSDEEELCSPIRGSRCEIYLHVDDPDQYDYFFTAYKKRFEVIYYINNIVRWRGFVEPELLDLPYTYPSVLTLSCTCGLALLKDITYEPVNSGMVSFFDVIRQCLDNLITREPWNTLILYESVWIYATDISQSAAASPLKNLYIPETIFYSDSDGWMSCYDILRQIVERFDCYIKQSRNGFYVLQNDALRGNFYLRSHDLRSGEYLSYTNANYIETYDNTNKFWLAGSQYKEILAGWESLTITQTYLLKDSLFHNNFTGVGSAAGINKDVSANDGILKVDINEIDPGSGTYQEIVLFRQLVVDNYIYDETQYLYIKIYLKARNDCWMHCRVRLTNGTTTYYLKSDGGWQTTSTTFITTDNTIGFYEIETETPPISGDIYIAFGALWPTGDYADSYYDVDIYNSVFKIKITEAEFQTESEFIRYTNSGYSLKKDIDTSIGDILSVNNNTSIYKTGIFYLSGSDYIPVTAWTILNDGDNATLNELIADQKAANYAQNIVKLKGTMSINDLNSMDILQIGTVKYQIISAEFEFLNNEVYLVLLSYN